MKNINIFNQIANKGATTMSTRLEEAHRIITVDAVDDTACRVIYNSSTKQFSYATFPNEGESLDKETFILGITAYTMSQIVEAKESSAVFILPTNVAIRFLQMNKVLRNDPAATADDLKNAIVQDWMIEQGRTQLITALEEMCNLYVELYRNPQVNYGVMKRHTLDKWELDASQCLENGIKEGQELTFEHGMDTEFGIQCRDTRMLKGEFTVSVDSYENQNTGETQYRFYVPRRGSGFKLSVARKLVEVCQENLPQPIAVEDIPILAEAADDSAI